MVFLFFMAVPSAQASKGIVGWFGSDAGSPNTAAGQLASPNGIAINSTGAGGVDPGTIYVVQSRRIDVYNPNGTWKARWGWNVIGRNEQQRVTVDATGGMFTLTFGGNTTAAIAYNASASTVQSQLTNLPSIGAGNVTVTQGCNNNGGICNPPYFWTITFTGALDGTDVNQITVDGSQLTGVNSVDGGPPTTKAETLVQGAGGSANTYEICTDPEICDAGDPSPTPAPNGGFSGSFDGARGIAVNQSDGSVYVTDRAFNRVQKFDAVGNPILVFGKDVNATEPGTDFEICTVASGDSCKQGLAGTGGGEFTRPGSSTGNGIAVAPPGAPNAGDVVVTDSASFRVQEFTKDGAFVRAFGWDVISRSAPDNDAGNEVQEVTIPASDGTFTLSFGSSTTPPLPYDASAAQVQSALNALSSISSGGGSVSVTGGPGDAAGANPYVVTFDGGPLADTDVAALTVNGRSLGAAPGTTVTCVGPDPNGRRMTTDYQWLRNGQPIPGATSSTYEITAADAGAAVQCQETSLIDPDETYFSDNKVGPGAGSIQVSVPVINVAPLPSTPRPVPPAELPDITATVLPGQSNGIGEDGGYTLHCQTGSWSGSPTFTYQWYRSGVPLSGHGADSKDYIVQPADLESPAIFQCAVTGTNAGGSVTLVSGGPAFGGFAQTSPDPNLVPNPNPSGSQVKDLASVATTTVGANFELCTVASECKAGIQGSGPGQFADFVAPTRVAVDSTGAIYTTESFRVQKFTPDGATLDPGVFGSDQPPPAGAPNSQVNDYNVMAVAIGNDDNVLVQKESATGATPTCLDGSSSAFERRVQELSSDGDLLDVHGVCAGISATSSMAAIASNPLTGDIYEALESPDGGFDRVYILGGANNAPEVDLNTPEPTATTAFITGTVTPDPNPTGYPHPPNTSWQLEYKLSSDSEWRKFRQPIDVGTGNSPVPFKITLTPLLPNSSYDVRVVATKQYNSSQTVGDAQTFTTHTAPPSIESARATGVGAGFADLNARINPQGSDTSYHFEYGTSPSYGQSTPETELGDGQGAGDAIAHIEGLEDAVYHFRVVATNDAGTSVSEDQTFAFHPPNCPNALLRQQTQTSYLPDCRAYELVSPAEAGNTVINSFTGPWSPYATSPSRLAYLGMFAPLPDTGNPPNNQDLYVSTRTINGWMTKYIGLPADQAYIFGGPPGPLGTAGYMMKNVQVTPSMDKILLWNLGDPEVTPSGASNAPYVFGADGTLVDRLPTNVNSIPNGADFKAQVSQLVASGDLTHFIFSSDIPFVPGAPPDAIYDNDVTARTLSIVNKDPTGASFSGYPVDLSTDGSHILMSTATVPVCNDSPCPAIPPGHFYMRVNDTQTRDVTKGFTGTFAGMTRDGTKVYFLSDQHVTSDDHDASTDLFMWDEDSDTVIRVSAGAAGTGDTDDCVAVDNWTSACSVKLIAPYERHCGGVPAGNCGDPAPKPTFYNGDYGTQIAAAGGHPDNDNFLAAKSGDIYFYSPEKLAGPEQGAAGMENLYVFHDGAIQFVASLDPEPVCRSENGLSAHTYCASGPIGRMQVTADGDFAAFTATSRLTGYDNQGVEEMYRYRSATGGVICVSCIPTGEPPTDRVYGSQNGLFLTTDGRTFFSTSDALVPDDTNDASDVYEYVGGRAQLITQGTGEVNEALCPQCGLGQFTAAGLIGVSADGQDVYFGTYDVLTPQDHNGGNLKIYDARTNGGFIFNAPPPGCEAADECHGDAAGPPPPLAQGTTVDLGDRGNSKTGASKRKRCSRRRAVGGRRMQRVRKCRKHRQHRRHRRHRKAGRHRHINSKSNHAKRNHRRGASK